MVAGQAGSTGASLEVIMAEFKAFELDELERAHSGGPPYQEFLCRPGVSLGLFRLPAAGADQQHPHAADEVYVVLGGRATLRVEGGGP